VDVYPISAATGEGVRDLLYHVSGMLAQMPEETTVYEQEYDPESMLELDASEPFTVAYDAKAKEYVVEGPKIERMLGYTNLETEKGFLFFQNFLRGFHHHFHCVHIQFMVTHLFLRGTRGCDFLLLL
jgi:GTP-binding protein